MLDPNIEPAQAPAYPESTPTVAPVPASPAEVPGVPDNSTQMSQEQMRTNLQDLMSKIDGKYQDFNAQNFSVNKQSQEQKSEVLRQIFDLFQQTGVDPSNVDEVGAFLNSIKEKNPELYQQIITVLENLIGEDNTTSEDTQPTDESQPGTEGTPGGFDPTTGQPMVGGTPQAGGFDPTTGQPIAG